VSSLRGYGKDAYLYLPADKAAAEDFPWVVSDTGKAGDISLFVVSDTDKAAAEDFPWVVSDTGKAGYLPLFVVSDTDKAAAKDFPWVVSDTGTWDCIVLDRFQTPAKEFERWRELAPVIGIDEGGQCRKQCDFLIDLLPGLTGISPPNIVAPWLLPLPHRRRASFQPEERKRGKKTPDKLVNILVSFGMEDPAKLTLPVVQSLAKQDRVQLTVIAPPSLDGTIPAGVRMLDLLPDLREYLGDYDLVITHFGLTAFEAIYARVPVILFSPSRYHAKLARAAGFCTAKIGDTITLNTEVSDQCRRLAKRFGLESPVNANALGELLAGIPALPAACPVCGQSAKKHLVRARFSDRTYRQCPVCGIIAMSRLTAPPIEYAKDYFFSSYKKQYGRTYLEDFPNLVPMAKNRLRHIQRLLPSGTLLDIGCAYGPFLVAAKDAGFLPTGIDPAADAVHYVTTTFAIPAIHGFFPDAIVSLSEAGAQFDVISLWYVIEHFEHIEKVLQEINRLLHSGGVLAFSTPSYSGISGRSCLAQFLQKSPADHWTIWSPGAVSKVLKRYGFVVKKTLVSGHHPERFPVLGMVRALHPLLRLLSRLFRLGDTFEVYAIKQ
jgi:2-polyprenyl-3-methyl-5-hydroxy-6-metoxy-1,4-benzoquinol methylase